MGANPLGQESDPWNIDMSTTMKANETHWPNDGRYETVNGVVGKSWWHSDYKDLPYLFTYKFFDKIVAEIK